MLNPYSEQMPVGDGARAISEAGVWFAELASKDSAFYAQTKKVLAHLYGNEVQADVYDPLVCAFSDPEQEADVDYTISHLALAAVACGNEVDEALLSPETKREVKRVVDITFKDAYEQEKTTDNIKAAQAETAKEVAALKDEATHDMLTGALNRRGAVDIIKGLISKSEQGKASEVLTILIDIVNFKKINDLIGYDIGDEVLVETFRELHELLRNTDKKNLARYGGDEVLAIIEGLGQADSHAVLARLAAAQDDKIDSQRHANAWGKICQIKLASSPFAASVRPYDVVIGNKNVRRMHLVVNGEVVCQLRDLCILASFRVFSAITSVHEYEQMLQTVFNTQLKDVKDSMHSRLGETYRDAWVW
jgi:diguanylate cyclase (GGDEF)-like protein